MKWLKKWDIPHPHKKYIKSLINSLINYFFIYLENIMAVIYLLEVGDESYVGKTCNLQRRMREHKCRARDGTSKLYKTIRDKEFKFSHKKLDECEDRTARIVEQAYITELNPSLNTNSAWGNDKVKKMARYKRKIMKKKHCKCCNKIISSTNWAKQRELRVKANQAMKILQLKKVVQERPREKPMIEEKNNILYKCIYG
jgi:hypothetical protein